MEITVFILLFVSLIRPFVRRFQSIDGLSVLPIVAFGLLAATLPAFGFRPELVPLSLYAMIAVLGGIPRLVDMARGLRADDFGERGLVVAAVRVLLLCSCFAVALAFRPAAPNSAPTREPVSYEISRRNGAVVLSLRVFRPEAEARPAPYPVFIFAPSVMGSSKAFDRFLGALADNGIIAVSFSRHGFDVPSETAAGRLILPSTKNFLDSVKALFGGKSRAFGVEASKRLEATRVEDVHAAVAEVFFRILSSDASDPVFSGADPDRVLVGGAGVGGSAALSIAGSDLTGRIKAVVAIEAPLFGFQEIEALPTRDGAEGLLSKIATAFDFARAACGLQRVAGVGPVPRSSLPTLIFASDTIRRTEDRDRRYAALIRYLRFASSSCAIVSLSGAGPLDYSDVPQEMPIYTAFAPPAERVSYETGSGDLSAPLRAAELIRSFIDGTLDEAISDPSVLIERN